MIKNIYIFIAIFTFLGLNAQEGIPTYSDYLTDNIYLIHPAMAGASNCSKLRLTGRQQWSGEKGAPSLMTASYNTRFDQYKPSAAGVILFNDKNGYHSQTGLYLTYAHHIMFSRNKVDLNQLSFGLSLGLIQSRLDQSEFDLLQDNGIFDPSATSNEKISTSYYNVDFGVAYHLLDFYVQFTIKNLLGSGRKLYSVEESTNLQRYLVSMGYVFASRNSDWSFEPSVLFQNISQTKESLFDVNIKAYRKMDFGKVWGGLSYRTSLDGAEYYSISGSSVGQKLQYITPFIGINYNQFMFGYTYTNQFGNVKLVDGGYNQITLGMNLNCAPEKYDCNCPGIN